MLKMNCQAGNIPASGSGNLEPSNKALSNTCVSSATPSHPATIYVKIMLKSQTAITYWQHLPLLLLLYNDCFSAGTLTACINIPSTAPTAPYIELMSY